MFFTCVSIIQIIRVYFLTLALGLDMGSLGD